MVPKGIKVRELKAKSLEERQTRSICIKISKKVEKPLIEEIIKGINEGIERVYFPRQKTPAFFFVLCKDDVVRKQVWESIKQLKNSDLGHLIPKKPKQRPGIIIRKNNSETIKKTIDPLTLVLEAIPKDLKTETISENFPMCNKVTRFNERRCYLQFSTISDAFNALKQLKSEPLCGFKISVRYNKLQKNKKNLMKSNQIAKKIGKD